MSLQKVAPETFQGEIFRELQELEEEKTKEALDLVGRKHTWKNWKMTGIEQGCYKGWDCQVPKVIFPGL